MSPSRVEFETMSITVDTEGVESLQNSLAISHPITVCGFSRRSFATL